MLAPLKESSDQPRLHIKKQRHYFANKGPSSQAIVFPVVMYGCESWTVKKAERRRIGAFELCCWRRLLRVPWTARRSIQSILKEISPDYSLKGLMWKLKLQYVGPLMMLGKIEGRRRREWQRWDGWMASATLWTWVWGGSRSWWWTGSLASCSPWGHKESDMTEQLSWTILQGIIINEKND